MPKIKRLYFKDINTIRFVAFTPIFLYLLSLFFANEKDKLTIIVSDTLRSFSTNSFDFFTFLSAFLITSIALREYKYKKKLSLKKFYARRLLRILPILIVLFSFSFLFHDKIIDFLKFTPLKQQSIKYYLIGLPNYFATISKERYAYTIVIWMIYMNLQFYFVWIIILKFFKSYLNIFSVILIGIGITSRLLHHYYNSDFMFNISSYGVSIGIGSFIASYNRTESNLQTWFKNLSKKYIKFIYSLGLLSILSLYIFFNNTIIESIIPLITIPFYTFMIMEQTFSKKSIYKLRKQKLLSRLGKISYGLLIFTPIVATIILIIFESLDKTLNTIFYKLAFIILTIIITWILSDLSYNYFEKIFNRVRRDFK